MGVLPEMAALAKVLITEPQNLLHRNSIKDTECWLQENYSKFPKGIDDVSYKKGAVTIQLSEEINPQIFASSADADGLMVTIKEEEEETVIAIHEINRYSSGRVQKVLAGTFQKTDEIPLDRNPVNSNEANSRLKYLTMYLEEKYGNKSSNPTLSTGPRKLR